LLGTGEYRRGPDLGAAKEPALCPAPAFSAQLVIVAITLLEYAGEAEEKERLPRAASQWPESFAFMVWPPKNRSMLKEVDEAWPARTLLSQCPEFAWKKGASRLAIYGLSASRFREN
jgi:hypothetical protein